MTRNRRVGGGWPLPPLCTSKVHPLLLNEYIPWGGGGVRSYQQPEEGGGASQTGWHRRFGAPQSQWHFSLCKPDGVFPSLGKNKKKNRDNIQATLTLLVLPPPASLLNALQVLLYPPRPLKTTQVFHCAVSYKIMPISVFYFFLLHVFCLWCEKWEDQSFLPRWL